MLDTKPILSFCVSLDRLAQKSECNAYDVEEFYNSVYECGRQFLSKSQDFSDIERDSIKQSFPSAIEKAAKFTAELIQNRKPNELKLLLSSIEFLIHDIYDIFKYFSLDDCPSNLAENISLLEEKQENIKKLIKSIKSTDVDGKDDIPNLDGIPETHDWWSQKEREGSFLFIIKIYHGNHVFDGYSLTYIGTYEFGGYNVTNNLQIVPTPGHTSTCISALVNNAETMNPNSPQPQPLGLVAITGDLFFKVEDLTDATIWKASSTDITKQEESRKAIMCDVDYIIPGHGAMFKVPAAQKVGCPAS